MDVNHGPFLVDNNLLLSSRSLWDMSEGGAYVHILMTGQIDNWYDMGRLTPYMQPHSTTRKMNSFLIKNLASISSLKPGYSEFVIKPGVVGDLTNVKASIYSPKERLNPEWIKTNNTSISVKTLIPVNCSYKVC